MLLPPSLDELIAQDHPVRIVNKVLDQIDIEPLIAKYKAGGYQQLPSPYAAKGDGVCLH